jgi:hypothetical protein
VNQTLRVSLRTAEALEKIQTIRKAASGSAVRKKDEAVGCISLPASGGSVFVNNLVVVECNGVFRGARAQIRLRWLRVVVGS